MMRTPDFQIFKINKDMKKTARILFSLICVSAALVACKKENATDSEEQLITAYVNAGPVNKLAYEEVMEGGGAGVQSYWQTGDHFLAIQDGEKVIDFKLVSGAGTTQGVFQALTSGVTSSTNWVGVVGNGAEAHSNEIHCGFMKQNGTISDLSGYNYVKVSATGDEPYFNFAEGEGLSYVLRIKLPAGIKCIEYTPCAWSKVTASETSIVYFNNNDQDDYSAKNTSTITLAEVSTSEQLAYIAIPLLDYSKTFDIVNGGKQYQNLKTGVVLTLLNNDSDNADASNGTIFENDVRGKGGLISTLDLSEMTLIPRPKPENAVKFINTSLSCKPHSSALNQAADSLITFWAPFEVGATEAGKAGYHIMYGMYEPYKGGSDSFVEYKYRGNPGPGQKYNSIGHSHAKLLDITGNTTFYSIESSRYDAARVLWGCAWRMPHCLEIQELLSSTRAAQTVGGQKCVKCTNAKTGNYIYLPVAGYKLDGATQESNYAEIWSANKINRTHENAGWNAGYIGYIKEDGTEPGYDRYEMKRAIPILPVLVSSEIK